MEYSEHLFNLLIRADANIQIGTGHIMRCLALAQAWQEQGGHATFACAHLPPSLETRLKAEGMGVENLSVERGSDEDAQHTIALAQRLQATWIVADGYHFGRNYQHLIKQTGLRLLLIDDYGHANYYEADIVLNQNISASEELYGSRSPHTRLLLGTRYVLLRREFWPWRTWKRDIPNIAHKILVTMGGSDPDNITLKVLQAMHQIDVVNLEIMVVVGGGNPHAEALESYISTIPHRTNLICNATNMPELMAWADVAVSAGGSTCWELAFMGVPNVVLILADNQRPIAEYLDRHGVSTNLGWHEDVMVHDLTQELITLLFNGKRRSSMSSQGQNLVDGEGIDRVIMHVKNEPLRLRQVQESDCRLVWEWANDPVVRSASFCSDDILWQDHTEWFDRKLHDPSCKYFIAIDEQDSTIGQVRFELEGAEGVISVSIEKDKRGFGYGSLLIRMGIERLTCGKSVCIIHSFIKEDNISSIRAFEKAGFQYYEKIVVKGHPAVHLIWNEHTARRRQ